jgi:hypothetical protein
MCLRIGKKKKYEKNNFFASLKSLKKGVGSGSVSKRHGPTDPDLDPDPHQNAMDPQHCVLFSIWFMVSRNKCTVIRVWKILNTLARISNRVLYTCLVLVKNPPNPPLSVFAPIKKELHTLSLYWGISLYISPT